jgi:molybdopterin-guanine dinucleotide biosynthesis protein B
MKVYGVIGWKNAGKTGLMERLVGDITGRGFSVSTVKHVHHDVDLDQPSKDTFRHRQAGAREVVLASRHRFALMAEHRGEEPELTAILARLAPVDLVLVEGYKRDAHPKIEVFRAETGQPLIQPGDPLVRAVATDVTGLGELPVPVLDLNDTGMIADFILSDLGLQSPTRFDCVVVVDWSAAATPSPARPSADAIWIGIARADGVETTYFRTRHTAEAFLTALVQRETAAGHRMLIGFDFPMGFPQGFAERLTGQASARAVHRWLAEAIQDAPDNANNRFAVAAGINERLGGGGPFWGRPEGLDLPHLPATKQVDYAALGLSERRSVETLVPRAQPVWKCYTTGSVGSQALMGLPVVHRLAEAGAAIWPFDPSPAPVVVAEVYPSLLAAAVAREGGIKDVAQVRLLALALYRAQGPLLDDMLRTPVIAQEEGWILGAGHAADLMALL